jgi:hypothetical protein
MNDEIVEWQGATDGYAERIKRKALDADITDQLEENAELIANLLEMDELSEGGMLRLKRAIGARKLLRAEQANIAIGAVRQPANIARAKDSRHTFIVMRRAYERGERT